MRRCYTVPGESFLGLLDAVDAHPDLDLISCRHESGAAFMAEADGKLSGRPAVALASRAPGASNLAIGVQTAHEDGTPMLAILGQVESDRLGTGAFQEIDLEAFYAPIAKWSATARSAAELPALVAHALQLATSGRPGPVAIAVPADLWDAPAGPPPAAVDPEPEQPMAAALDEAARLLRGARRPVAIVGGATRGARAQVVAAAERLDIGVYTAFRRQHLFPNDHGHYLGQLTIATPDPVLAALDAADVLLLIGTRIDEITGQRGRIPRRDCPVVAIGPDTRLPPGTVVAGRAVAPALEQLCDRAHPAAPRDWSAAHAAARAATQVPQAPRGPGVHPARAVAALARAVGGDAIVTNDAGNFAAFLHRHWWFGPRGVMLAPANGAMGYAVPAAVAAKLAAPAATVVAVVGDGGVLMTGQEIETAVRMRAKILVVVFQNGLYGTIAMHQARTTGRTAAVELGLPDLARWAQALGAHGETVHSERELERALAAAARAEGPAVVAVRTDPDVIAPGTRLSALLADAR